MMVTKCALKLPGVLALTFLFSTAFAQTSYSDRIAEWKKLFPKEDVIAASCREVVDFSLNPSPKPGEGKVKATVLNEVTLVPVKDFLKYDDGIFYNDEISVDQIKIISPDGKEVKFDKNCSSYSEENIFHSD